MKVITFFLILIGMSAFCQDKNKTNLYLDDNLNKITKEEFLEKEKSWMFFSRTLNLEDKTYHVLDYHVKMGQLNSTENESLRKQFAETYNINNIKDKTIFIHYIKNLRGYSKTRENFGPVKVVMSFSNDTIQYKMTKAHYLKRKTSYDASVKKCHQYNVEHNIAHLHFYKKNEDYIFNNTNFKWHKANDILRSKFFKYDSWAYLILKPNGDYAKLLEYLPLSKIKKLLEKKDWSTYKKTYNTAVKKYETKPRGFFYTNWYNIRGDYKQFETNKKVSKSEFRKLYEQYRVNSVQTDCFSLGF